MLHIGCKFECLDLGVYIVLDCLHSLGVTDGLVRVFARSSLRLRWADQKHFCPLQNRIESSRPKCATHPLIIRAARHSSHSDTGSMCIALACPILWSFQIGSRWIVPLSPLPCHFEWIVWSKISDVCQTGNSICNTFHRLDFWRPVIDVDTYDLTLLIWNVIHLGDQVRFLGWQSLTSYNPTCPYTMILW